MWVCGVSEPVRGHREHSSALLHAHVHVVGRLPSRMCVCARAVRVGVVMYGSSVVPSDGDQGRWSCVLG